METATEMVNGVVSRTLDNPAFGPRANLARLFAGRNPQYVHLAARRVLSHQARRKVRGRPGIDGYCGRRANRPGFGRSGELSLADVPDKLCPAKICCSDSPNSGGLSIPTMSRWSGLPVRLTANPARLLDLLPCWPRASGPNARTAASILEGRKRRHASGWRPHRQRESGCHGELPRRAMQ